MIYNARWLEYRSRSNISKGRLPEDVLGTGRWTLTPLSGMIPHLLLVISVTEQDAC